MNVTHSFLAVRVLQKALEHGRVSDRRTRRSEKVMKKAEVVAALFGGGAAAVLVGLIVYFVSNHW